MTRLHILTFAASALLLAGAAGCSSDVEPYGLTLQAGSGGSGGDTPKPTATLTADTRTIDFDQTNSTEVGVTTTDRTAWTATASDRWISVSPTAGIGSATITVSAQTNPTTERREGSVTISSPDAAADVTIAVRQAGSYVRVQPTTVDFAATAGTERVTITSNLAWQLTGIPTWLTVSPQKGEAGITELTLTSADNTTTQVNRATIVIGTAYNAVQDLLSVARAANLPVDPGQGDFLTVEEPEQALTAQAGSVTFYVSTNTAWTATSNRTWLTLTPASGDKSKTVTATAQANTGTAAREATVTVRAGTQTVTLTIAQPGQQQSHTEPAVPGQGDNPLPQSSRLQ